MACKSNFMKWVERQIDTDADLKQKVEKYLNEMIIEEKLTALPLPCGPQKKMTGATRGGARLE